MSFINLPASQQYPTYLTYGDLPTPSKLGDIAIVFQTTGIWPLRRSQGFYVSNGAVWSYLGDLSPSYIRDLYEANIDRNAFTNLYKSTLDNLAAGLTTAASIVVPMECDSSTAVGDLVIADESLINHAAAINSNVYSNLVVGAIQSKPTSTQCLVQVSGILDGYAELQPGKPVFVNIDGRPTTTAPLIGDLQVIGTAIKTTAIALSVSPIKVIR